jgi:hypothetical protein
MKNDQTTVPMDEEQALFPKSPKEIADHFLSHFQDDVEKAEKSLVTARKNLREAITLRDEAELNLMRAIENEKREKTTESTAEEVEEGYLIEGPPAQIEGEVEEGEIVEEDADIQTGEILLSKIPGDPEPEVEVEAPEPVLCIPDDERFVWVSWPNAEDSIRLMVGEKTRWGELVANYLNANPEEDFLARYVISDADGTTYDPKVEIPVAAYGREFFLETEMALKKAEA